MTDKISLHRSMANVYRGGLATSAMDTLAVGPTLTAYALMFGAQDIAIGILGAIPFIGNMTHLFAAQMIEKGVSVKKISVWSSFLSRPFYLFAALLAFVPTASWALPALIFFLSMAYIIGCLCGGSWMAWMKMLIPSRLMGRFFATRFQGMMIVKIICFLGAYFLLKETRINGEENIFTYAFLLTLSCLIGLYGAYTFVGVQDKPIPHKKEIPFFKKIAHTFQNKPFMRILSALGFLNFSINFVTPFFTVFMLQKLGVAIEDILILNLIQWLSFTFVIKKWGRIADKKGPDHILIAAIPFFITCICCFIGLNFITLSGTVLFAALLAINLIMGIVTAALNLGINNVSLMYIPNETASIYLSVNSVFKSFAGAMGSIIAGITLAFFNNILPILGVQNTEQTSWALFFITTAVLALPALYLLKRIKTA